MSSCTDRSRLESLPTNIVATKIVVAAPASNKIPSTTLKLDDTDIAVKKQYISLLFCWIVFCTNTRRYIQNHMKRVSDIHWGIPLSHYIKCHFCVSFVEFIVSMIMCWNAIFDLVCFLILIGDVHCESKCHQSFTLWLFVLIHVALEYIIIFNKNKMLQFFIGHSILYHDFVQQKYSNENILVLIHFVPIFIFTRFQFSVFSFLGCFIFLSSNQSFTILLSINVEMFRVLFNCCLRHLSATFF